MSAWLGFACAWGLPAVAALWTLAALLSQLRARLRAPEPPLPGRAELGFALGLGLVGALVRLFFVPALYGHSFDGHEAEYYELFLGSRPMEPGSTAYYPAMQALWYGLGHLLPRVPATVILFSAALGVGAAGLLASGLGKLAAGRPGRLGSGGSRRSC